MPVQWCRLKFYQKKKLQKGRTSINIHFFTLKRPHLLDDLYGDIAGGQVDCLNTDRIS